MQNNVHESHHLETTQGADMFTRVNVGDTIMARLLSVRCREAQTQSLLNQDYANLMGRQDGSSLCFCVCDGVGSSYKGDFAAHFLATRLLRWLYELREIPVDQDTFSGTLHGLLDLWSYEAQIQLKQIAIAAETPTLAREVLEELRDTYGSETVFMCGRIDSGQWSTQLHVSHPKKALFCWMGNVTARLAITSDRCIELGDRSDTAGRWSTVRGRRGAVTIWSVTLSTIEQLTVYTDGLEAIGKELATFSDDEWHIQTQRLLLLPKNDDMTALELRWMHDHPEEELFS